VRFDRGDIDADVALEPRVAVGNETGPVENGCVPIRAARRIGPALEIKAKREPSSTAMLQTVNRPSIGMSRITGPANSTAQPAAPAIPSCRMTLSMMSFGVTPLPGLPANAIRISGGFFRMLVWVASVCSTSPAHDAQAATPSAPTVQEWLSSTVNVEPGSASPASGAATLLMPCIGLSTSKCVKPNLSAFSRMARVQLVARSAAVPAPGLRKVGTV